MELKVTVEGVERCISGLTEDTTCAQIIYALAHATGQKGRFVLAEKYGEAERNLAPTDRPLEILKRRDVHVCDVSFELKRLNGSLPFFQTDSFNLKGSVESSVQTAFASTVSSESNLLFNPERSSSPINDTSQIEKNKSIKQDMKLYEKRCFEIPRTSSDVCFKPVFSRINDQSTIQKFSVSSVSQTGSLKNRPPPPAYHEVIEQRYNSLSRGASCANQTSKLSNVNICIDGLEIDRALKVLNHSINEDGFVKSTTNLSLAELERLIENQQSIIERQKTFLLQLDVSTVDDNQRELFQLERQQTNLRLVLNPLRSRDLPGLLEKERCELERINSQINDLQQKITHNAKELNEHSLLEIKLNEQIRVLEREITDLESSALCSEDEIGDNQLHEMLIS